MGIKMSQLLNISLSKLDWKVEGTGTTTYLKSIFPPNEDLWEPAAEWSKISLPMAIVNKSLDFFFLNGQLVYISTILQMWRTIYHMSICVYRVQRRQPLSKKWSSYKVKKKVILEQGIKAVIWNKNAMLWSQCKTFFMVKSEYGT